MHVFIPDKGKNLADTTLASTAAVGTFSTLISVCTETGSPFAPLTNRHAKGLGDARLVGTIHTPVFWYSCCWDPCFWVELDHVELILALTLTSSLHTSM